MKTRKVLFAAIFLLSAVRPAWSQSINPAPGPVIFGYLNSRTNMFRPLSLSSVTSPQAISSATGKIVVSFSITIQSAIATTTPISCDVNPNFYDANGTTNVIAGYIVEDAAVTASRTGSTATCTVTIPYSWNLSFRSMDQVEIDYTISAVPTSGLPRRTSQQTIAIINIPANGATTSFSVKTTI